jgi:hypothetical protein
MARALLCIINFKPFWKESRLITYIKQWWGITKKYLKSMKSDLTSSPERFFCVFHFLVLLTSRFRKMKPRKGWICDIIYSVSKICDRKPVSRTSQRKICERIKVLRFSWQKIMVMGTITRNNLRPNPEIGYPLSFLSLTQLPQIYLHICLWSPSSVNLDVMMCTQFQNIWLLLAIEGRNVVVVIVRN